MEQNKEQDQGDGLVAETRQLLDAATELTAEWYIERTYNKRVPDHWSVDVLSDDDHVCSVRGRDEGAHALAALIAAAPRLLANWLACGQADDRQVQALIDANRDLADENRALREGIEKLIRWAESYRMHHVAIALRDLLAAADRGVTDGDRNEGDER